MVLYDRLRDRPLTVSKYDLTVHERETSSDFTRVTTVLALHGDGVTGYGEDVTYEAADHRALQEWDGTVPLAGEHTVDSFSRLVGDLDLFPATDPSREVFRNYRRWAFESAALDLALKQADTTLAAALNRSYSPVRFVVSTRLGDPPSFDRLAALLEIDPGLEFKLDPTPEWSPELITRVAETDAVRILDLKGHYEGTSVDQPPDVELYTRLVERFPDAVIEDPALTTETRPILSDHRERIAWDAPIHGVEDVEALPWRPRWLNVKPSRFGSIESLLATIEYCEAHDVTCYGGGQFELDVGRQHIHALASLFYPDGPNDVAPGGYNDPDPWPGLPSSPLAPPTDVEGLQWVHGA